MKLLQQRPHGEPEERILRAVPDVATLEKDWDAVGVKMVDNLGRRLDFHALRHTFATNLERHGVSRATKKKLMRHAAEDITDGYLHSELEEMSRAIFQLRCPDTYQPEEVVQNAIGTYGGDPSLRWTYTGHATPTSGHRPTPLGTNMPRRHKSKTGRKNQEIVMDGHGVARPDLIGVGTGDIVRKEGPDTQVD